MIKLKKKKKFGLIFLGLLLLIFLLFPLPKPLFDNPYSTLLESKEGELLSAKIAEDGQWRFPISDTVPLKFEKSILQFEDEYFYYHPGINPISIFRAAKQNWEAGKVVSGGSTISMQLVRLARKGKSRTHWQKLIELFWALRVELRYSKKEILALYAAHAPFGGNVVGLEAASWRYYHRPPDQLSWAESATLAVLPNAPALIYPGRNQNALLKKRNRLLDKLKENGVIDASTAELAKSEGLPSKPLALPQDAIHLLNRNLSNGGKGKRLNTTLQKPLQQRLIQLVQRKYKLYAQNEVHNLAVLIIDNAKNEVIAYVGNSKVKGGGHGHKVDIITSKRSTGSLLKPFLYSLAWQDGLLSTQSLLPDIPTQFGSYAPKNFNKKYDGAVMASSALSRSLNVPAVRLLKEYGVERFYDELQKFPMPSINRGSDYYGLSIILGGAEASLWEMCTAYKGMSESLKNVQQRSYTYDEIDYSFPNYLIKNSENKEEEKKLKQPKVEAAVLWQLMESLKEGNRPGQEEGWQSFATRRKIAWKTGTSFGLRDAWAIGVCPEYTIGVWVGNADGEGRPGLTGIRMAAPVLFESFSLLGESSWYEPPYDELYEIEICKQSGYLKGLHCSAADTLLVNEAAQKMQTCPYHQSIQLNREKTKRVNSSCYAVADMQTAQYLVLPPLMEWYYRKKEPTYKSLPDWEEACQKLETKAMELISPENADQILIPIDLEGNLGRLVVKVAHRDPAATIYWHLDEEYIGESSGIHSKELNPSEGKHILTLMDEDGNQLSKQFKVVVE